MAAKAKSLRIYFVLHGDRRLSGSLIRAWDCLFDQPPPAAYGRNEDDVCAQLETQLAERLADGEGIARYLWDQDFQIRRAQVEVYPQTLIDKQPVIGKRRVPLHLTYLAARMEGGGFRLMLPRFGWWMLVEELSVADEVIRNAISGALLGEDSTWLYDFRREGEEYVRNWSSDLTAQRALALDDDDPSGGFPVANDVSEEWVRLASRRRLARVLGSVPAAKNLLDLANRDPLPSVLLVGDAGVGKTAAVRQFARLLAKGSVDGRRRIWRTSGDRLIAGMVYLGMWQERCFNLINELRNEGDYLYVDRLTSILKAQSDGACIADLLLPAIRSGEIAVLAECSEIELERSRQRNPQLIDQFEILRMPPMASGLVAPLLEQYLTSQAKDLSVDGLALRQLVELLEVFQPQMAFPGKGFHFVDWLGQQKAGKREHLRSADMAQAFSRFSGLPVQLLAEDTPLPAAKVAEALREGVVGQDDATQVCGEMVARFKARLQDPQQPVGTLLFVGPTGVGKTELAKQLTRYLFGDSSRMIRLDMSEYMSSDSPSRLLEIGRGSQSLAEKIRQNPLSLILFDEVEKAHPSVFDLLLGLLGEGRLTDALGRLVDFRMSIVVMTSNLGVSETPPAGFGDRQQDDFLQKVRQHFRPEFFNRIDRVIPFGQLGPAHILRIVDLELKKASERTGLTRRGLTLDVEPEVKEVLAQRGFHPTRGARPLKRIIEELVVGPLGIRLAADPSLTNRKVAVVLQGGSIWNKLNDEERKQCILVSRS
jgi:ATP-dependent Clp protease ATP-binding subunit ClpC